MRDRSLTPEQQATELHDEFLVESGFFKVRGDTVLRNRALIHINAILDAYLDLWPELIHD